MFYIEALVIRNTMVSCTMININIYIYLNKAPKIAL